MRLHVQEGRGGVREVETEPTTFRLRDGCSASIWTAPDGSSLLTLGALSAQTAPDGYKRIVWMIKRMIKAHPTENRCQGKQRSPRAPESSRRIRQKIGCQGDPLTALPLDLPRSSRLPWRRKRPTPLLRNAWIGPRWLWLRGGGRLCWLLRAWLRLLGHGLPP
jgi:hypothetical protein